MWVKWENANMIFPAIYHIMNNRALEIYVMNKDGIWLTNPYSMIYVLLQYEQSLYLKNIRIIGSSCRCLASVWERYFVQQCEMLPSDFSQFAILFITTWIHLVCTKITIFPSLFCLEILYISSSLIYFLLLLYNNSSK